VESIQISCRTAHCALACGALFLPPTPKGIEENFVRRISLLVITSLALNGCTLTRVSDEGHARDVGELNVIGSGLTEARSVAEQKGFECNEHIRQNVSVLSNNVVRKTNVLECTKTSMEVFCPQRRYVVFNADTKTGKVYTVGKRIDQRSCF